MTAATLRTLAAETATTVAQVTGMTEQARQRGLTAAQDLATARLYKEVLRLRITRDRAADDLVTANSNYDTALTNYRAHTGKDQT